MLTLGIESSCDETSLAVVDSGRRVLSNVILSQEVHSIFGGVIPEVASREHLRTIMPIYNRALSEAQVSLSDIDLVASTVGPGLVGPLLVGLSFAKGLAWGGNLPFVPVNHLEGHIASTILCFPEIERHHLCLIVSGGHTMLVEVKKFAEYNILGSTRDDAAGEAFDKVAKLLGLGYPGGRALSVLAENGDASYVHFPRPVMKQQYIFSFSGLKTAVSLHVNKLSDSELEKHRKDVAASFEAAVVDVLVQKTMRAAAELRINHISVVGGVAANKSLRTTFRAAAEVDSKRIFFPPAELCTDNAAMIAAAGFYRFELFGPGELVANAIPNLKLE